VTSIFSTGAAIPVTLFILSQIVYAGNETQNILINEELQVPGAVLVPGKYTLSAADHLYDRTIVQVSRVGHNERYFMLAVPATKVDNGGGLTFFRQNEDGKAALKAWGALEFVYPKAQAIKISGESGETVLAVDPEADKLPVKMSRDHMRVVTLWSVSPKQLTSDKRGMGVSVVKYASASDSSATAGVPTVPAVVPVQNARASSHQTAKKLPKTASNNYAYLLYGVILFGLGAGLRGLRVRQGMSL
jgi:hypothetical protein